jgi:psiF repeat
MKVLSTLTCCTLLAFAGSAFAATKSASTTGPSCKAQAHAQKLKGKDRTAFVKNCQANKHA